MNKFKDVLVYLRKRSGLTQLELAEALGLSKSMISMYERGERNPSYEMLEAIADYFNVDIDILTGRSRNRYNSLSKKAVEMAEKYDLLDDRGKSVIDALIDLEMARLEGHK